MIDFDVCSTDDMLAKHRRETDISTDPMGRKQAKGVSHPDRPSGSGGRDSLE